MTRGTKKDRYKGVSSSPLEVVTTCDSSFSRERERVFQ